MALERVDRLGDVFGSRQPADAPARHGVGLGNAVDDNGTFFEFLARRGDGEMFDAVVDEFGIDLVGKHVNTRLFHHFADGADLLFGVHGARGIGGRVEHEKFGLGRDRLFDVFGRNFEVVVLAPFHKHAHAAADLDEFGIGEPVRSGNDDFVAFFQKREHRVEDGMFRARGHDDLGRLVIEVIVFFEFLRDLFAQFEQSRRGRIFGKSLIERRFRRVDDVLRRVEIGLARAETDDRFSFRFHRLRFCGDRKGERWRNGGNSSCDAHDFLYLVKIY